MANGKLGSAALAATTNTTVYTVPGTASFAVVNFNVCNKGNVSANIRVAVAPAAVPVDQDYIEYDTVIESAGNRGNVLERTGIFMAQGEKLVVYSSEANIIIRVHGIEEAV